MLLPGLILFRTEMLSTYRKYYGDLKYTLFSAVNPVYLRRHRVFREILYFTVRNNSTQAIAMLASSPAARIRRLASVAAALSQARHRLLATRG